MTEIPYGDDSPRATVSDAHPSVAALVGNDPPEPPDFDAFWERTMAEADCNRLNLQREPVQSPFKNLSIEDLTFAGYEGTSVHAWLIRPLEHERVVPLLVQYCGYRSGRGLAVDHLAWASAGFAHVVMDTRGQGLDTPDLVHVESRGPDDAHVARGIETPETYYYRRLIVDAVRMVQAARLLPEVAAELTVVAGASQGGGLALATAALLPDVAKLLCDLPFMCQWQRALQLADRGPYAALTAVLAARPELALAARRTLSYFDGVHFATRAHSAAEFSVALRDRVCPPSTSLAAYAAYAGPKTLATYVYNDHEGGGSAHTMRQIESVTEWLGTRVTSQPTQHA